MKDNLRLDVENIYYLIRLNYVYYFKHFFPRNEENRDDRRHSVPLCNLTFSEPLSVCPCGRLI
jgi:hypothetical protein